MCAGMSLHAPVPVFQKQDPGAQGLKIRIPQKPNKKEKEVVLQ